jgi:hypothetical protein
MTTGSRIVWVRLRMMLAVFAAALFPMVASGTMASAESVVAYQFDGLAFYQFGAPADLCCGPGGSPDTGFIRVTNSGPSTFVGIIGFIAEGGNGVDYTSTYPITLNPGDHVSVSINDESSNQGGYNGFVGAEFMMSGMVSLGAASQAVLLTIFDRDIHSGSPRTNPYGVTLDNFILQGGDPFGRDTGDGYETTQAPGPFQFAQAGPSEQPITASGMTFSATEGTIFSGPVASFTDPDTAATSSEYTATIDWGDSSALDSTAVIAGGAGSFTVSGTHTYADEGTYGVTVTVTDVDNASNTATANSTANVGDAALASTCATPPASSTSFNGNVANLIDANSQATTADFTATISWGDGSSSAGTVSGPTGGPFTVSGSHTYGSTGPESISATVTDDGGSTTSVSGCTVLIFAPVSTGGAFVIGDGNSAPGTAVTFWGAQWWTLNTLRGGPAPASFKGFALSPAAPSCGADWSTDPGNSAPPPAGPLPAFIGVIVTSSSSQSGSQISGNTVHMVVVQTNPGYGPAVGHAGTGTVVAQVC